MKLFTLQTADVNGPAFPWYGGVGNLDVRGTFDSATVKLQYVAADGTWADVPSASRTTAGVATVDFGVATMRGVVTGGGGLLSISATLYEPAR